MAYSTDSASKEAHFIENAKKQIEEKLNSIPDWRQKGAAALLVDLNDIVQDLANKYMEFATAAGTDSSSPASSLNAARQKISEIIESKKAEPELVAPVTSDAVQLSGGDARVLAWEPIFQELNQSWGAKAHIIQTGGGYKLYINSNRQIDKGKDANNYADTTLTQAALAAKNLQNEAACLFTLTDNQIKLELSDSTSVVVRKNAIQFALDAAIAHAEGGALIFEKLPDSAENKAFLAKALIKSSQNIAALDFTSLTEKDKKALIQAIEQKQFKTSTPEKLSAKENLLGKLKTASEKALGSDLDLNFEDPSDADDDEERLLPSSQARKTRAAPPMPFYAEHRNERANLGTTSDDALLTGSSVESSAS